MTASELIAELQKVDPNMPVVFQKSCERYDLFRTEVVQSYKNYRIIGDAGDWCKDEKIKVLRLRFS